ncbi:MAG: hypothetical protein U1D30_22305 [Planctomycetota bacterium]
MARGGLVLALLLIVSAGNAFGQMYSSDVYGFDPNIPYPGNGGGVYYRRGPAVTAPRGPGAVTWYNVGGGYSSAPQTGLPWQRRSAPPHRPWTTEAPTAPNIVTRSSRVAGREYYVRAVNPPLTPGAEPPNSNRFEEELATVGDKTVTPVGKMKPRNVPRRINPPSPRPVPTPRPIQPVGTKKTAPAAKTAPPSRQ